jgi:hypothetical protein
MRRRTVLGALGVGGLVALAGCLDLDFGDGDDTSGDTSAGTDGDGGNGTSGDETGTEASDDGDSGSDDNSGSDDGDSGTGGNNGNDDGDSGAGGNNGNDDGDSGSNGNASENGDDGGDGNGDDGSGSGGNGGGDGDGSGVGSGEPSLSVSVEPGLAESRNEYTLTVEGIGSSGDTDIGELAITFGESSGIEQFILETVRADDVGVAATGVGNPGIEAVQVGDGRELLITLASSVALSAVDGETVVSIEFLRAPTSGEFDISLTLRDNAGDAITELEATYEIGEST